MHGTALSRRSAMHVVPDYKANRAALPDLLAPQFGMVREVLDALCVACLDLVGYEADDILATLATRARDSGQDVVVVTGDRDAFQLVEDPHVAVLYTRRGTSDTTLVRRGRGSRSGPGSGRSTTRCSPRLRGDPSDNLAGVPGVGEKTAAKLVNKYKDLDGDLRPPGRDDPEPAEEPRRAPKRRCGGT